MQAIFDYWLVSLPLNDANEKQNGASDELIYRKISDYFLSSSAADIFPVEIMPFRVQLVIALKIGSMDALVRASDDLAMYDLNAEQVASSMMANIENLLMSEFSLEQARHDISLCSHLFVGDSNAKLNFRDSSAVC